MVWAATFLSLFFGVQKFYIITLSYCVWILTKFFFGKFWNFFKTKFFLTKKFKIRDDSKLHSYIIFCWLLTLQQKRIDQEYLNRRYFATFRVLVHSKKFSISFFTSCKIEIFCESYCGCMVLLNDNQKCTM